jgi:hypothetical protein
MSAAVKTTSLGLADLPFGAEVLIDGAGGSQALVFAV